MKQNEANDEHDLKTNIYETTLNSIVVGDKINYLFYDKINKIHYIFIKLYL